MSVSHVLKDAACIVGIGETAVCRKPLSELEEGVRILSNAIDCPVDELKTGMPVHVDFEKQNDSVTLPRRG